MGGQTDRWMDGQMDKQTGWTDGWTDGSTDNGDSIRPSVGQGSDEWADRQTHRQKDNSDFIGPSARWSPIKALLQLPSVSSPTTTIKCCLMDIMLNGYYWVKQTTFSCNTERLHVFQ